MRHNSFAADHRQMGNTGARAGLRPIDIATAWRGEPKPRPWLVQDLVPLRNVTLLAGDGGVGKTLLAQQLATATAIGADWLGLPVTAGKALCILCEDETDELHRRQAAINEAFGCSMADLTGRLHIVPRVDMENLLLEWPDQYKAGETTALLSDIMNFAVDSDVRLVVLDSLHDLFGGNENIRGHARQFVSALRRVAMGANCAVLLNSHPSMAGRNNGTGESGSTAWNNAVRSRLYLRRPEARPGEAADCDERVLVTKKANYGAIGGEIRLRYAGGVLVPLSQPGGVVAAIDAGNAERVFLELLDRAVANDIAVSLHKTAPNYAPRAFLSYPSVDRQGFGRDDLASAMDRLLFAGKIKLGAVGQTSSRHTRHGLVRA